MKRRIATPRFLGIPSAALALLAALIVLHCTATAKKCSEIHPDQLETLAKDAHVLLKIDRIFPSGDPEKHYKELCNRFEESPEGRVKDLIIGHFAIDADGSDKEKKAKELAREFGSGDKSSWPTYVLLKKGAEVTTEAIKFEGDEKVGGLTNFLKDEVDVQVGVMLSYIEMLDKMASRFMRTYEHEETNAQLKRHLYACVAKFMILFFRGESKELAQMYGEIFSSILKEGNECPVNSTNRLEEMLQSDSNMSYEKKEELAQKIFLLDRFINLADVSAEDDRMFLFALGWFVFLLAVIVLMVVYVLFFGDKNSGEETAYMKNTRGKSDSKEVIGKRTDSKEVELVMKKEQ